MISTITRLVNPQRHALGVHRESVIRWVRQLTQSGRAGLKKAGRAGRKPKLGAVELRKIEQGLRRGPEALGYATGLWTACGVREFIEYETGCGTTQPASGSSCASLGATPVLDIGESAIA